MTKLEAVNLSIQREIDYRNNINTVETVELQNFKLFKNIKIELSEKINIVIGKNGYGKTSLLQALALGLAPIQHQEFEAKDRTYQYKKYINKNVFTQYQNKTEQYAIVSFDFRNANQSYRIYSESITFNQDSAKLPPNYLVLAYGANLFCNEKLTIKEIVQKIIKEDGVNFSIYSILEDYTENFYNPLSIIQELTDNSPRLFPEKKLEIEEKVKLLIDTLNIFLNIQEPDSYKIEQNLSENGNYIKGNYYFTNARGRWELNELSEGYRKNILLITDILLRIIAARKVLLPNEPINQLFKKVRGTILIDEYDKHLHPNWQRKLIFSLKEVFSNMQFVLTTHNIFSLQSAAGENALILSDDGSQCEVSRIENKNILGVIRQYFTKDIYNFETQNLLDRYNLDLEEIYNGNYEVAENNEFRERLSELLKIGGEFEQIIARDLMQLNKEYKFENYFWCKNTGELCGKTESANEIIHRLDLNSSERVEYRLQLYTNEIIFKNKNLQSYRYVK